MEYRHKTIDEIWHEILSDPRLIAAMESPQDFREQIAFDVLKEHSTNIQPLKGKQNA